ncbi:MAG: DUF4959 domain-containing protein [Tannerella sp.]|nr:DUF4959 domain-containing protein [Tannerella sp.]
MKQISKNRKRHPVMYFLCRLLMPVIPAALMWSCTEVKDWNDPTDNIPPGTVTNVNVRNLNGGAIIHYTRPNDSDLMGVKAVFSFGEDDVPQEVYASAFRDSIVVDGYADTNEHTVELYAIDKSGNLSAPAPVIIKPETPPVELIRQTLNVSPTFGGVYASWDNPLGKSMDIALYTIDSVGDRVLHDRYYSSGVTGRYTFRNLEIREQPIHIELRDRWNHYALPLDTVMEPLFETQIMGRDEMGRNIWSLYGLEDKTNTYRGDSNVPLNSTPFSVLHNGILYNSGDWWATDVCMLQNYIPGGGTNYLYPVYFTIDMGVPSVYSRLAYYTRNRSPSYSAWCWYEFEVWGTNTRPKDPAEVGDGSVLDNLKYWTGWESVEATDAWKNDWIKLADCVIRFPSGTPNNVSSVTSAEDIAFVQNGFHFDVDTDKTSVPCRYIRFVVRKTNNGANYLQASELCFWGAYVN